MKVIDPQEVINILIDEIDTYHPQWVTIEGFPFRAYPEHNSPYLARTGIAFQKGWQLTNDIHTALQENRPNITTKHFFLLDDNIYNPDGSISLRPNRHSVSDYDFLQQNVLAVQNCFTNPLPIFSSIDSYMLEGTIRVEKCAKTCAEIDMHSNLRKFLEALDEGKEIHSMIHIVVHPIIYWKQQREMLMASLKLASSKQSKIWGKIASSMQRNYRHIWIDKQGNIVDITKPHFENGNMNQITHKGIKRMNQRKKR